MATPDWIEKASEVIAREFVNSERDPLSVAACGWNDRGYVIAGRAADELSRFRNSEIRLVTDRRRHVLAAGTQLTALQSEILSLQAALAKHVGWQHELKPKIDPVFQQFVLEELTAVCEQYDNVRWNAEAGSWQLLAKPKQDLVVADDESGQEFNFGRWTLHLGMSTRAPGRQDVDTRFRLSCMPDVRHDREGYPHPHVSSNMSLCEGEARSAIRSAYREGRLLDVLNLVTSVLSTYGAQSPYKALGLWTAVNEAQTWICAGCRGRHQEASRDGRVFCDVCDVSLCNDCEVYCEFCQRTFCPTHRTGQPGCDHSEHADEYICGDCGEARRIAGVDLWFLKSEPR